MSRIKIPKKELKEFKEIIDLAKTNDESAFQQNHRYRKFKDQNINIEICVNMIQGFWKIKFLNESVFWCQKVLENSRVGEKDFKWVALSMITQSFRRLENYEKVIEYGKKAIEHLMKSLEPGGQFARNNCLLVILEHMIFAFKKLDKKKEAMKYAREFLKVSVELHNTVEDIEKGFQKVVLLNSYICLVDLQIQLGESKLAKKSFERHFKLFNLNSMDPNDVLLALKEEGYENILPLAKCKQTQKLSTEFAKRFIDSPEVMREKWEEKVVVFHSVSQMCWKKHFVFFGGKSNQTWGNLSLDICLNILKHIKVIIENKEKYSYFNFDLLHPIVIDAISMTLILADQNHLKRENLFSNLFLLIRSVMTDPNKENICSYVGAAQRKNDKINLQKVMPFIQFCLKSLDEGANSLENINLRMQFVMLKNSLMIVNHLKTNVKKEEY